MTTKKDLIIAIVGTFCLTSTLFMMIVPIRSQTNNGTYDPWMDLNDDGVIDSTDLGLLGTAWGTTGEPINKTALLYEVNATFTQLLSKINSLNSTVIELQNTVNYLNSTVVYLNETLVYLNSTGLGKPDYDSGWVESHAFSQLRFTHNLNTNASKLLVYVLGSYKDGSGWRIHQMFYGSDEFFDLGGQHVVHGLYWYSVNDNEILVNNMALTESANAYKNVRIMIWKIREP